MRGLAAHKAKVAGGIHEPRAEMIMPKAIGQHAGGDGVVLGDPISQGYPAFPFVGIGL